MPGQLPSRSAEAHRGSRAGTILTALVLCAIGDTALAQAPTPDRPQSAIDQGTPVERNTGAREEPKENVPAPTVAARPTVWPRLHLADPVARLAARQALDLAWERLGEPGCGSVLDGFTDGSGRPLEQQLRALSVDLQTYLTMVVFIDASRERPCVTGTLAFTSPGNRVVRLCLDELKRIWQQDPEHVVATLIHEMLHSLGLTENPPSSAEITRRVLEVCHRR